MLQNLKILQHSSIILFKLKFHHKTSCDWMKKSLINPHWAFCSKQIFEQCKKESYVRHTFTGSNIVSAAQPRKGLLSPP